MSKVTVRPTAGKIVIRPSDPDMMTPGGIILPDSTDLPGGLKGRVVSVGAGQIGPTGEEIPMEVKEGDEVIWMPGYGMSGLAVELDLDGETYLIIEESAVVAIKEGGE